MSQRLVLRRIVLPQMWRFATPGLGNAWLLLLKSTSLMSVVGLDELTRKSYIAAGACDRAPDDLRDVRRQLLQDQHEPPRLLDGPE